MERISIESAENDIAIVGISCKLPGDVNSPQEFWNFLLDGGDGIVDVPADRWDNSAYYDKDKEKPNKMYVNRGGFLNSIDQFDPQFFGISPKEAPHIDPQHRWLLELTYEAFENAGIKVSALKGSDTAVYIGQFMHDYEQLQLDSAARHMMSSHSATGPSMTLTANRISYAFDLTGPSVTLDTACSSSLVALDMACKALLNGDSKLAIAGGVNILLRPELTMSICKASMLSPDCKCQSFDANANGYVRSEGAGIVLVKKLKDAQRDGDKILAVIKATGVNQDGQTIGITVPNGASQKKLLLSSLAKANIAANEIQYAEAHGTGTAVGDPIEVNALGSVLGHRNSTDEQCIIGSVKSNIGHTEAAAGVAGLIKTVMALNEKIIPQNIHFNQINPAINLEELNVRIADKNLAWPNTHGKTRKAIVNSFGFGGTNAIAILQEPPQPMPVSQDQKPVFNSDIKLLLLSSKTEQGLKDQAQNYQAYFQKDKSPSLHDTCYTAATKREHYQHRLAVSGKNIQEMNEGLEDFFASKASPHYLHGVGSSQPGGRIAFVFSGMGPQWAGMGKDLYEVEPVFKAMMDKCDAELKKYTGWSLVNFILDASDPTQIDATYIAQPAIFAVQTSLAELLKSWGVMPAYIVGHSAGEVAAAFVAGALSFEDAIKVIYHRSQLQHTTEGMGTMLAVGVDEATLQPYLKGVETKVSIAAINSEQALTLAGDQDALKVIADQLDQQGLFARFLNVGVPYHSPVMDRLKAPLIKALQGIQVNAPAVPLYSSVTAQLTKVGDWSAEYWADNVREPVLFKAAIDCISKANPDGFLEISPHPALSSSIEKNIKNHKKRMPVTSTLKRNQNDNEMLARTLASLHTSGIAIDWDKLYPGKGQIVNLPNYAWQHSAYWWESDEVQQARLKNIRQRGGFGEASHPLLGGKLKSPSLLWQKTIDLNEQEYLLDHQVEGNVVYPGAAYIETALSMASASKKNGTISLHNIEFKKALFLTPENQTVIESQFNNDDGRFTISAFDSEKDEWELFSTGIANDIGHQSLASGVGLLNLTAKFPKTFTKAEFYQHCHTLGLTYQNRFQAVEKAWFDNSESVVEILLPEIFDDKDYEQYLLHPSILDGAFQSLFPTIGKGYLPVKITELNYHQKPGRNLYCHLVTNYKDEFKIHGDIRLFNTKDELLVEVLGVELKALQSTADSADNSDSLLYDFNWIEQPLLPFEHQSSVQTDDNNHWIIFSDKKGVGERLSEQLKAFSHRVTMIKLEDLEDKKSGRIAAEDSLTHTQAIEELIRAHSNNCRGFVYLWGLDTQFTQEMNADQLMDDCALTSTLPLQVAQAIGKVTWKQKPTIFLVSNSAWQIDGEAPTTIPSQGALWGFGRVFASEHAEFSISLIDLPLTLEDSILNQLVNQLLSPVYEQEIALRPSKRYVNRLGKINSYALADYARKESQNILNLPYQLTSIAQTSGEKKWALQEILLGEPGDTDLWVAVESYALDRDDLGFIERSDQQGRSFICVGKVLEKGTRVTQFSIGDEVIALAKGEVSSSIIVESSTAIKKPHLLDPQRASVFFKAFMSAHYAVNHLARLGADETILIHDAADTHGLAAIQLAKINSASIYVTADTEEKRAYLFGLGLTQVFDSSEPNLAALMSALRANNTKLDVVLNTLTGKAITQSLEAMNLFGRFIELGKYEGAPLNHLQMQEIRNKNISYHLLDASKMNSERAKLCCDLMNEVAALFIQGDLSALVCKEFSIADVSHANAYLQSASAAEIISVDLSKAEVPIIRKTEKNIVKPNHTYLVTGGLGGLGLELMDWLISLGAQSIVLLGRGKPSDDANSRIMMASKHGAKIIPMQADITQLEDVKKVLAFIESELLPLAGIVHSAGVLDDATIAQQTPEKFHKVLAPKIKGAWNLHQLTSHIDLDFFISFSSIASIVGWAGQSNYASANGFLDGLATYRQGLGKTALTVNWGPWGGAGMAANLDEKDIQRMKDSGMGLLTAEQGMTSMSQLLAARVPQAGVFELDWSLLTRQYPDPEQKTLLKDFFINEPKNNAHPLNFIDQLSSAPAHLRASILEDKVSFLLADIVGLDSAASVDKDRNVFEYGLNSLMAMDLKNRLQRALNIRLPATLVLKHPTVNAMVEHIIECALEEVFSDKVAAAQEILLWHPDKSDEITNCEINGSLPFTLSVLHWFKQGKSTHFNIGFMVGFEDEKFDFEVLKTSIKILFTYHDGCRLQLFPEENSFAQSIVPLADSVQIHQYDFSDLSYAEGVARMDEENEKLHKSFTFTQGSPLFRMAHYQLNDVNHHRFFLIFHHYLSDGLSQKIIAEDLKSIYEKVFTHQPVYLPAKRDSLIDWTNRLHSFAKKEALQELPYWESVIKKSESSKLFREKSESQSAKTKTYSLASIEINNERYQSLIKLCSQHHIEMTDVAIFALVKAFSRLTKAESLWVDLVIHARTGVFDGVDVQNIFGQISESASVLFELAPDKKLIEQLKSLKDQRIKTPHGGLGLKALRYINKGEDVLSRLGTDAAPQVLVNFDLSNYGQEGMNDWVFMAKEDIGEADPPVVDNDYPREFYITGTLKEGALSIVFMYHNENFHQNTVAKIIDDMDRVLVNMQSSGVAILENANP